jgi:hypothetical protein
MEKPAPLRQPGLFSGLQVLWLLMANSVSVNVTIDLPLCF